MLNIKSVHCHGRLSCTHAVIGNVGHRIWMHSQDYAIVNGVGNDLHFGDTYSCYSCNVANISGEIYAIGPLSMQSAEIATLSVVKYLVVDNDHWHIQQ